MQDAIYSVGTSDSRIILDSDSNENYQATGVRTSRCIFYLGSTEVIVMSSKSLHESRAVSPAANLACNKRSLGSVDMRLLTKPVLCRSESGVPFPPFEYAMPRLIESPEQKKDKA